MLVIARPSNLTVRDATPLKLSAFLLHFYGLYLFFFSFPSMQLLDVASHDVYCQSRRRTRFRWPIKWFRCFNRQIASVVNMLIDTPVSNSSGCSPGTVLHDGVRSTTHRNCKAEHRMSLNAFVSCCEKLITRLCIPTDTRRPAMTEEFRRKKNTLFSPLSSVCHPCLVSPGGS